MIDGVQFVGVQLRMMKLLADGQQHTKRELHGCLSDDLGPLRNISAHVTAINKKLRRVGHEVVCVSRGHAGVRYRLVRLMHSAYDGKR